MILCRRGKAKEALQCATSATVHKLVEGNTNLQGPGREVDFLGYTSGRMYQRNRKSVYWGIGHRQSMTSRMTQERPCVEPLPSGNLARDRAGEEVEPYAARIGKHVEVSTVTRSRHSTTTPLCGCAGGCAQAQGRRRKADITLAHLYRCGSCACAGLGTVAVGEGVKSIAEPDAGNLHVQVRWRDMKRIMVATKAPPDERGGNRYVRPTRKF